MKPVLSRRSLQVLCRIGVPALLLQAVLFVGPPLERDLDLLEIFSGAAVLCTTFKEYGMKSYMP
jgi:hypothetical protein